MNYKSNDKNSQDKVDMYKENASSMSELNQEESPEYLFSFKKNKVEDKSEASD